MYEKKVSCMANFNLEGRNNVAANSPRPNALANTPAGMRLSQPLRLPRVGEGQRGWGAGSRIFPRSRASLHWVRGKCKPRPRLPLPRTQVTSTEVLLAARCKRVFANAHTYHINSISVNSDQETFLSADDLRINLWNLEITEQSFNMVDIKPANMEDLTEVRRGARSGRGQRKRATWVCARAAGT